MRVKGFKFWVFSVIEYRLYDIREEGKEEKGSIY